MGHIFFWQWGNFILQRNLKLMSIFFVNEFPDPIINAISGTMGVS